MPVSKLSLVISQTHQQHSPCHSNIQFHHYHDFKIMVDLELQPERPLFPHRHDVVLYMAAPPPPFLCSRPTAILGDPHTEGRPTLPEKLPWTEALPSWPVSAMAISS